MTPMIEANRLVRREIYVTATRAIQRQVGIEVAEVPALEQLFDKAFPPSPTDD